MREYLSPGVYTQENDKSFLQSSTPSGPAAVFIGGFTKGQAFVPMKIKDTKDLLQRTGQPNGKFYSQYAALQYSKHKGDFWVQRLLWQEGYKSSGYAIIGYSGSVTNTASILAILAPVGEDVTLTDVRAGSKSSTTDDAFKTDYSFSFKAGNMTYTFSSVSEINSIQNVFSTNPIQQSGSLYLFNKYESVITGSTYNTISILKINDLINHSGQMYDHARTPWINNQFSDRLFKIHHTSDGTYTNRDVKIAIQNVSTTSQYTTFDVIVRAYDDNDRRPKIIQTYYDVNLNPTSDQFISKKIGDMYYDYDVTSKKLQIRGNFPNISKYIRVQTSTKVDNNNVPKLGLPYTVDRLPAPYSSSDTSALDIVWEYPTVYTSTGSWPSRNFYNHQGYDVSLYQVQALSSPTGKNTGSWDSSSADVFTGNYIVPMFGGFDGKNPTTGYITSGSFLTGFDLTSLTSSGSLAYIKALDMLKNVEQFDIDIISIAGVNLQTGLKNIFEYALQDICQYRGDCIVVADALKMEELNVNRVSLSTADFDSSFGAVYYPAVKIKDPYTKTFPVIPASTYIPAVIAYTQNVSQPHYAPAGINRGTLNVLQAVNKLSTLQRDVLYKNNINPIASFAANGTVVWGQKTLQKASSALDRINVRILINRIKKWIDMYGKSVLFDNNTVSLRQIFTLGVERHLNEIVSSNGLYAYKFQMDQSNNTSEVIDRNQLVGQVWLKPTKASEFIIIPINIVRSDAVI